MQEINFGNMQIGDGNTINDFRGSDCEQFYWKVLKESLMKSDLEDDGLIQQTKVYVAEKNKSGLRALLNKYGVPFISTVLGNVSSDYLSKLLAWILS